VSRRRTHVWKEWDNRRKNKDEQDEQEMQDGMTVHRFPLEERPEVEPWPVAVPWSPLVELKPQEAVEDK